MKKNDKQNFYFYNINLKSKGSVINGCRREEVLNKIRLGYSKQKIASLYCKGKIKILERSLNLWNKQKNTNSFIK